MENRIIFDNAKDYQKFLSELDKLPKGVNRPIRDKHAQVMTVSVLKLGVTRMINIVRTSAFGKKNGLYVLDGQHLIKAILGISASQLKGHFIVTIEDIEERDDIVSTITLINSTASNYKLEEYLASWVSLGKKDYILLEDTLRRTKQNINSLVEAYTMTKSDGNNDFKEGRFKADKGNLSKVMDMHDKAIKAGLTRNQAGFKAIVRMRINYPSIGIDDVVKAIKKNPAFGFRNSRDGYINLFKELIDIR